MNGRLILVATPIGNLGDITVRAREVLADADTICCEDTRRTRELLAALSIPTRGRLVALHGHNEASVAARVVEWVAGGRQVALVTDAGTPAVSDPGSRVVASVAAAGLTVTTTPGPSAALAALTVSGLSSDRFCVEGFLPRRGVPRRERISAIADEDRTVVIFESPLRLPGTLVELAEVIGGRRGAVVRELTKVHEEVVRGTIAELASAFAAATRGEVVLVVEGAPPHRAPSDEDVANAVADELTAGTSLRDAATRVAQSLGVAHRRAYEIALATRRRSEA